MYVPWFVALCVPPAVDPAGHVIPLACEFPLYVFALGLLGIVSVFAFIVTLTGEVEFDASL